MKGRVCLVTGANRGIGKATGLGLAQMGATVAMVCRDRRRGEAARDEIRRKSRNDEIELLLADLSSQESIRRLSGEVRRRFVALHVLVNNAGVVMHKRKLTEDGLEMTFAVNHLGYFLLTCLLLELLKESAPARIVNVSSEAHRRAPLDLNDLQGERSFRGIPAYCNSKLANILFTRELARRLAGTGVTVNCLHPGVIRTGLLDEYARQMWPLVRLILPVARYFFISPEKGAETSIYLASSPEVDGVSGRYFKEGKEADSSRRSHERELATRLWELSGQLTGTGCQLTGTGCQLTATSSQPTEISGQPTGI